MNDCREKGWTARALVLLCLTLGPWLAPMAALAQVTIESISGAPSAAGDVVRVELSQPLSAPAKGFAVQTPPRVAIDLPEVTSGLERSVVEINQGNVRTVRVAQDGDRTRLILSLKQAATFSTRIEGKALVIQLDPAGAAPTAVAAAPEAAAASAPTTETPGAASSPAPVAAPVAAAPPGASPTVAAAPASPAGAPAAAEGLPALREIDFRRGADGAGRLIVRLSNPQVGVDVRQQGLGLLLEFQRSSLPENLRRRFDVVDFGTPVQAIAATQAGDRVRLLVESKGAWEHSAYQTENQFVLEVRPLRVDPNRLAQGSGFTGDKLSLNFQNIEVRSLLQVIADFTNFNVITSDSVSGAVSLRLKDVPWDQALDIILQTRNLGARKTGNVLWVAPRDELNARDQGDLEVRKKLTELEPLRTQSFQLNYTKAEDVARVLNGMSTGGGGGLGASGLGAAAGASSRLLSPRGSLMFEARTNQLFVTDIPGKLEEVQAMIAKIDIPVRQVLIEARIVEADDSFGRALGVKLGGSDLRGVRGGMPGYALGGDNRISAGSSMGTVGVQTGQVSGALSMNDIQFVNLPANTSNFGAGSAAATFALSLFGATANRFLNLELSALEAEGKGKIVSSPRVITADQKKALIEQGEELPYQSATSSGATAVSFRKANLKLEVVPQITPEGNLILDVDINKDSVGRSTTSGYAIDTKHIKTEVLVENGGTVVIGGIFTQTEKDTVNQVPLLGDVPVLGNLFRNKERTFTKTELLVFITPKIVTDRVEGR